MKTKILTDFQIYISAPLKVMTQLSLTPLLTNYNVYHTKKTLLNKSSRKDYKVIFTLTSYKSSEGTFSVLKRIKT